MSYSILKGGRLAALLGLLGLGLTAAFGQMLPPDDLPPDGFFQWNRGQWVDDWDQGSNWVGQTTPTIDADVLFSNAPLVNTYATNGYGYKSPLTVEIGYSNRYINSLWFDTGREYSINGAGTFILGRTAANGDKIITGLNNYSSSSWQSEHNINSGIRVSLAQDTWAAQIASFSAGGMRLGGDVYLDKGHLIQRGGGAIHIAGSLSGSGTSVTRHSLTVATDAGHMILSGNNLTWKGKLTVNHGFLVATANNALGNISGSVAINGTWSGASLAFRPKFVGPNLNNSAGMGYTAQQSISIRGKGYDRPWFGAVDPYNPHSALYLLPVGALYNDGGNNTFGGSIWVNSNFDETWIGSRDGVLRLTGRLFGTTISPGNNFLYFRKVGNGVLDLANGNPGFNGAEITISEGVLRLSHSNALGNNQTLVMFDGGILELGSGNFHGTLGINNQGETGWEYGKNGGFSAYGETRSVTLNNGATLTWGVTDGFISDAGILRLSSAYANAQIHFNNPINLGESSSSVRSIHVERGLTREAGGTLEGEISGAGRLVKRGLGTLHLSNTANNYTGETIIAGGTLRGVVPSGSPIRFLGFIFSLGGVLGIDGDFSRNTYGTGSQILWAPNADGGFAAYGGNRSVTLNGGAYITQGGTAGFVSNNRSLIFGAYDATGTVWFNNSLSPSSYIRLIKGKLDIASVVFNAPFGMSDPSGIAPKAFFHQSVSFEGDGRADLIQSHAGVPIVVDTFSTRGAEIRFSHNFQLPSEVLNDYAVFKASWGGRIQIDNSSVQILNRLPSAALISLNAGNFQMWGGLNQTAEAVGQLSLDGGANSVKIEALTAFSLSGLIPVSNTQLGFNDLYRKTGNTMLPDLSSYKEQPTINFQGNYLRGYGGVGERIYFKESPERIGDIMPYATLNGKDWARVLFQASRFFILPYTNYEMGDSTTWDQPTTQASPDVDQTLTSFRGVNSLRLVPGRKINLNGYQLWINSGGLLASSGASTQASITGGFLYTEKVSGVRRPLFAHVYNEAGLLITSTIEASQLVKTGGGPLLLSENTNASFTSILVHEGTLALAKTGNGKVHASQIIVGDHSGIDTLRLDTAQSIISTANITLRGGHPNPERFLMAEGVLQFNGINGSGVGIRQTINNLVIEGRGVIDFRGGEAGRANFLIINGNLTFGNDSKLFIRNWYEYEDYILIRRGGASSVDFSKIEFEGYGRAFFRNWDNEYYLMTPMPEPRTYGAILGTAGLGLWNWRRRRKCHA